MKTTDKKPFLNMDERNRQIAGRVIAIMYFLTILALQGIILYRQFALKQEVSDFEDFAIVLTVNSVFLISALLYFGAIQIRNLKIKTILLIYIVFVVFGSAFTYAKYNLLQSPGISNRLFINKVLIIAAIIGLMMGFWILLSILGKRRIDKELE